MPLVIVVDGIISAGKTTLLEFLIPSLIKEGFVVTLVPEPVDQWNKSGRLEMFYKDPKRRAFQFQTCAFHDRVKISQELHKQYNNSTDIFIMERSIFTDILFMNSLYENGTVDDTEYIDYLNLWSMWENVMPLKPDLFIYLKPDIQIAMDRLKKRNRKGEENITTEYQTNLEKWHDIFFKNDHVMILNKEVPVIKIENNGDIRSNPSLRDQITLKILEQINLQSEEDEVYSHYRIMPAMIIISFFILLIASLFH